MFMDDYKKAKFTIRYENKSETSFFVLFNPTQYVIRKSAKYTNTEPVDTKGGNNDGSGVKNANNAKNFVGTSDATLSLELFLDTTVPEYFDEDADKPEDVKDIVDKFMGMCEASDGQHKPPKVEFSWGSQIFEGYVHSVNATYLLFDSEGKPLRAKVNLTISESELPSKKIKDAKSSPDRTKARTVKDDSDIFNIAYREFADPMMWKLICKTNNISNPLNIPPGTVLKVPSLD